jgi:5'-nucleotidase
MNILLTNDDGIHARGLIALYEEMTKEANCIVVAPEIEQSAVGHAITISRPLLVKRTRKNGRFFGYAIAGTPADCVKIGITELAENPVDLVISGINLGANVGINVIYSGTVSAATEAVILGVPSMAVSLDTRREADFSYAAQVARKLAVFIMKHPLLNPLALNVNVPVIPPKKIRGVAVVKQGKGRLLENFDKRMDPRDNVYYWLAGETQFTEKEDSDSDACALKKGWITITPIQSDLTRYDALETLRDTFSKATILD